MTNDIRIDEGKPFKHFVLGLAFDARREKVVLIEKNRPDYQAGLLNGVGGKVEAFDADALDAMRREFFEECGIETRHDDWHSLARMAGSFGEVLVFCAYSDVFLNATQKTDEVIRIVAVDDPAIRHRSVQNVAVLVAAGLAFQIGDRSYITIDYGV